MRDLILLRHAETSQGKPGDTDLERPLSPVGKDEAEDAGRWLASHGAAPERVLCSTAQRAVSTAELACKHLGPCTQQLEPVIYSASPGELIALLDACSEAQILLVGHNPGIEQLIALLTSGQSGDFRGVPPAGIAWIRLEGKLEPGAGELHAFWSP